MSHPPPRDEPMLSAGVAAHLRSNAPLGECLDAETLAVYAEGESLTDGRALVEAHLASCLRCQTHLAALVRCEPPSLAAPSRAFVLPWRWIVPLTSAALIIVTVLVTRPSPPPPGEVNDEKVAAAPAPAPPAPELQGTPGPPPLTEAPAKLNRGAERAPQTLADRSPRQEAARATKAQPTLRARVGEETEPKREEAAKQTASADHSLSAPATPPAPAPAPAAGAAPQARERADIAASTRPRVSSQWRVTNGAVERTPDGGQTWTTSLQPEGITLRAISCPSPNVCWAVGDAGAVFRTADGVNWISIAFPENVGLVSVEAQDADRAVVAASDGRRFATEDGGAQWQLVPAV